MSREEALAFEDTPPEPAWRVSGARARGFAR